jgi:hypothetical protein
LTKQNQNNKKSIGKSIVAYGFKKYQEKNPQIKTLETIAKKFLFPISKNPKGMDVKSIENLFRLASGFLIFCDFHL